MMHSLSPSSAALESVSFGEHQFQFLPTGASALDTLISRIDAAQRSICLEMYIFRADATGDRVRAALLSARQRGLPVFMVLDHFGSGDLPRHHFDELQKAGAHIRFFNPSRVLRVAFRNHRKLCVIDDRIAIVGGFNVGDEYAGDGVHAGWRDLGLEISGPLIVELQRSFYRMFSAARMDRKAFTFISRGRYRHAPSLDRPALLTAGPGFGGALMRRALYRDLLGSRRVSVVAAYFAPTWTMRRRLSKAAKQGSVQLILAGKSDVQILRMAAQHLYSRLLRDGVRIAEFQPQILHTKLFVIDDVVYVGSCNLDVRSLRLNFELLVRIPCPALAEQARVLFAADLKQSIQVASEEWTSKTGRWEKMKRRVAYWMVMRLDPFLARRRLKSLR
ncbi:MAG TPA: phospholipase D-like domain-containing protein [Steroidobacteraceae bacterium]|nr:phospholipase D-like domain-containing protein [Steroidobacteraceae bacterium]